LDFSTDQYDLLKEAALHWLRSYFTIVEKRQNDSFDSEDMALLEDMRARILEYYLLEDESITYTLKKGMPLEAMTLGTLAPTIRY
jgi:coproporphyrinogen III oxidase